MSPRTFLASSASDPTARSMSRSDATPLEIQLGDVIGVVLMNLGGPATPSDVEQFLYSRLMDPAEVRSALPGFLRHFVIGFVARRRSKKLKEAYAQIGGNSPLARHSSEQAQALERGLNERFSASTGATFRTYLAMRHSHPSSEEAAAQMAADGVTKVVFLPLHPHYSTSTTGSSLAYWRALEAAGEIPVWQSTSVREYAAHPKYVRALAERVDEGLQRFPREVRERVEVVFAAHGSLRGRVEGEDPYCCLVHATVHHVMAERESEDPGRKVHVAFQEPLVGTTGLDPRLCDTIEELADLGRTAILIVPVSFVSDRVETAYEIDVRVREFAHGNGIEYFEVSSGLNCHPLFLAGLAECVASQLTALSASRGDGAASSGEADVAAMPRHPAERSSIRCSTCKRIVEPCDWGAPLSFGPTSSNGLRVEPAEVKRSESS